MRIALRLQQVREELSLTVDDLAAVASCGAADLERWEAGEAFPSLPEAVRLGEALSLSLDWLIGRADEQRWSPALYAAQLMLRSHLLAREDDTGTPGARIVRVMDLLQRHLPPLSTILFTRWLGLLPESYRLLAADTLPASTVVIERAAQLSGLQERWFRTGRVEDLVFAPLDAYAPVLVRLRDEGLGPEDILRVMGVAKAIKQAENGAP